MMVAEEETHRLIRDITENLEIDLHKSKQLICDKGTKQSNREKITFSTNGVRTTGHHWQIKLI
jgi:hypothetical protein